MDEQLELVDVEELVEQQRAQRLRREGLHGQLLDAVHVATDGLLQHKLALGLRLSLALLVSVDNGKLLGGLLNLELDHLVLGG